MRQCTYKKDDTWTPGSFIASTTHCAFRIIKTSIRAYLVCLQYALFWCGQAQVKQSVAFLFLFVVMVHPLPYIMLYYHLTISLSSLPLYICETAALISNGHSGT